MDRESRQPPATSLRPNSNPRSRRKHSCIQASDLKSLYDELDETVASVGRLHHEADDDCFSIASSRAVTPVESRLIIGNMHHVGSKLGSHTSANRSVQTFESRHSTSSTRTKRSTRNRQSLEELVYATILEASQLEDTEDRQEPDYDVTSTRNILEDLLCASVATAGALPTLFEDHTEYSVPNQVDIVSHNNSLPHVSEQMSDGNEIQQPWDECMLDGKTVSETNQEIIEMVAHQLAESASASLQASCIDNQKPSFNPASSIDPTGPSSLKEVLNQVRPYETAYTAQERSLTGKDCWVPSKEQRGALCVIGDSIDTTSKRTCAFDKPTMDLDDLWIPFDNDTNPFYHSSGIDTMK